MNVDGATAVLRPVSIESKPLSGSLVKDKPSGTCSRCRHSKRNRSWWWTSGCVPIAVLGLAVAVSHAAPPGRTCRRVELHGEVDAGQEWKAPFGQGWVFRVLPISASPAGYSGWDLVVDRDPPAGYPDALLLATLPYNSINEREIGTTFGLRAQDAIGWSPRSFHFLSNPAEFRDAQQWFRRLNSDVKTRAPAASSDAMNRLLDVEKGASSGQLRILDARITPGVANPQPFAQDWALAFSRTKHEIESAPPGQESATGKMLWMQFEVTLWLPQRWGLPAGVQAVRASCPE
jgi:hypothetical protein